MLKNNKGKTSGCFTFGIITLVLIIYLSYKLGKPCYDNEILKTEIFNVVRQGQVSYPEEWYQDTVSEIANSKFGIPIESDDVEVNLNVGESLVRVNIKFEYIVEVAFPKYVKELHFKPEIQTTIYNSDLLSF